jgi:DNA-binding HxlR family transcriptional regulator
LSFASDIPLTRDPVATASSRPDRRSGCPISVSLEIFGDRWSLLVVRDLMFKGMRTFKEFAAAGEGIATNVLAERLERLESAGIVARAADPADARRVLYRLTEKGMGLAPVLVEMVIWAARYEDTDAPVETVRAMRRDRAAFITSLSTPSVQRRGSRRPGRRSP